MMDIEDLIDPRRLIQIDVKLTSYFIKIGTLIEPIHKDMRMTKDQANKIMNDFNEFLQDFTEAEKTTFMMWMKGVFITRVAALLDYIESHGMGGEEEEL